MPSEYLATADYAEYAPDAMPSQVRRASGLIDNYLDRPEGLVWAADSLGRPAYMTAISPAQVVTLAAPVSPGARVVVALPFASYDLIGEVFVLDRAQATLCEIVTVVGVDPVAGTITLARVAKGHATGALLESGLAIIEDRALPAGRSIARVSRPNLAGLLSAVGRYGYGRRSDQAGGYGNDLNLLANLQTLGAAQSWQPIDVANISTSAVTGECWITPGLMLATFSEVRLRYIAGFSAAALPSAIKQATANVLKALAQEVDANSIYRVVQAGGTKMERFSDRNIDGDTAALLWSYRTRVTV